MILAALLAILPHLDGLWKLVEASPKVSVPEVTLGTGVAVGVKDGFVYLLTANHVAVADRVEVEFTSRQRYPDRAWYGDGAEVVARWPDPDIALVRFPLQKREVSVLPLAPAWQRPKAFPTPAVSVGVGGSAAGVPRGESVVGKEFVRREGRGPAFFWRAERAQERGRSGGPLLDVRGRVIGIAVAVRDGAGYYAHHDEILAALKRDGYGWLIPEK